MIKWPISLIKDLAEGRCVVFLGSGVSCNSTNATGRRPKAWRALLESAAGLVSDDKKKKCIKKCIERYDYLMACELVRLALGDDGFNDFLAEEFQSPGFIPAGIHRDIFLLTAPIVITPNFDKIYDSYVSTEGLGTVPILNYYSEDILSFIRSGIPLVLKIHGTIDERSRLIFSKKDYAEARNEFATFYKLLEALILTKTFLFLGTGLNDPDLQLLLENFKFQYGKTRKHFFVIHDKEYAEEELSIYENTLNLSFLKYDWNRKTKSHQDFIDSIADLRTQVESERSSKFPVV